MTGPLYTLNVGETDPGRLSMVATSDESEKI